MEPPPIDWDQLNAIIDKHKGEIRMESVPGQGTKCIIELPLTSGNSSM